MSATKQLESLAKPSAAARRNQSFYKENESVILGGGAVLLVLAIREPSDQSEFDGLPTLRVGGLGDEDARDLLAWAVPGGLDERVRDRIIAEARGNPRARGRLTSEWVVPSPSASRRSSGPRLPP